MHSSIITHKQFSLFSKKSNNCICVLHCVTKGLPGNRIYWRFFFIFSIEDVLKRLLEGNRQAGGEYRHHYQQSVPNARCVNQAFWEIPIPLRSSCNYSHMNDVTQDQEKTSPGCQPIAISEIINNCSRPLLSGVICYATVCKGNDHFT